MQTGQRHEPVKKDDISTGPILGRGNGGYVYRGIHKQSGTPMAVKCINLFNKDQRHQFYNEFDMIQKWCPVFVRYYGCFVDEGTIHLMMEYMDCGSLLTMISVEKQFL